MNNVQKKYSRSKDDIENIIRSLDYLKEEAKRGGFSDLHDIIETASFLGKKHYFELDEISFEGLNDDMRNAVMFILQFLNSSKDVRGLFLSIVSGNDN
ncbi:MAG: hypothetical protein ACRBDI_00520 [Alphaproteobacteria bacterium]